jgi:hypothetical protein
VVVVVVAVAVVAVVVVVVAVVAVVAVVIAVVVAVVVAVAAAAAAAAVVTTTFAVLSPLPLLFQSVAVVRIDIKRNVVFLLLFRPTVFFACVRRPTIALWHSWCSVIVASLVAFVVMVVFFLPLFFLLLPFFSQFTLLHGNLLRRQTTIFGTLRTEIDFNDGLFGVATFARPFVGFGFLLDAKRRAFVASKHVEFHEW